MKPPVIGFAIWLFLVSSGGGSSAIAQVIPDGTLSTTVTQSGNNFTITNGNQVGTNLFHSFSQFSVPTGGSAFFNNATTIQNIFARVTGGNISNIDGLIHANGSANLFLLNPSGILFGPNASLNLGGSFIASTANSVVFADGVKFSATDTTVPHLLTVSVPVGLQMGQSSGNIQVQGQGHNILHASIFLTPVERDLSLGGLRVQPGRTLALVGNGIQLDGGVLIAESGQVELGSVNVGTVALNATISRWNLSYERVSGFGDIHLTHASLLDASGNPGGSIQVQGKDIQILNSSIFFIQNHGVHGAGSIRINADRLEIRGGLPDRDQSLILSENIGSNQGANIDISARQIVLKDGSNIFSTTYQNGGRGGDISVRSTESILASGLSTFHTARYSGILSRTYQGGGHGGDISVITPNLALINGGGILALVVGGARGGNVSISSNSISILGGDFNVGAGSAIAASSFFGGDAGALAIKTQQLRLGSAGLISASTSGAGNAGNLTIDASEFIDIDGSGSMSALPSRITAAGQLLPPTFRSIFGLSQFPTGNSGNLTITTPRLQVRNQGYVSADNVGRGDAGQLQIQADSIFLNNKGQIRTSAVVGNAGSLDITVRDLILMRHNSLISARAGALGNGGNISINAPILLGLENSDITASAVQGRGGNIQITTQGIFGLAFRPRLTPESDITASSEFGVSGNVQISTINTDPSSGLVELPVEVVDPSQRIATGCTDMSGSSFVATGRGGVPQNPTQQITGDRTWNDMRDLSAYRQRGQGVAHSPRPVSPSPIVQATSWQRNPITGEVELIAAQPASPNLFATCAIAPR
jgi:filamentous hemagglutinin family protein